MTEILKSRYMDDLTGQMFLRLMKCPSPPRKIEEIIYESDDNDDDTAAVSVLTLLPFFSTPTIIESVPASRTPSPVSKRVKYTVSDLNAVLSSLPLLKSSWDSEKKKRAAGDLISQSTGKKVSVPGKKFSPSQYSTEFLAWLDTTTAYLLSRDDKAFRLHVNEAGHTITYPNQAKIVTLDKAELSHDNDSFIQIPGDDRCSGCRNVFVGKPEDSNQNLAFYPCQNGQKKAIRCVRCRAIEWALSLPVDATSGMVTMTSPSVQCSVKRCNLPWSLEDVCIVRVTK